MIQSITEYLRKSVELPVERDKFISKNQCFKKTLDQYFGQELPGKEFSCKLFEQVAFGQGNEKEKIDTVYSSSLQSFLIFSGVSENNPITGAYDINKSLKAETAGGRTDPVAMRTDREEFCIAKPVSIYNREMETVFAYRNQR